MCGITGVILSEPSPILGQLDASLKCLAKRGPDDAGFIAVSEEGNVHQGYTRDTPTQVREGLRHQGAKDIEDLVSTPFRAAFGHRRLSILDLSPLGHQPMCDPEGRYWITYNGEIYNFRELRSELQGKGHHFASNSDTEVLLKAYLTWGAACLDRLNGMFAFLIWDQKNNDVFVARDRVGIKPFYYHLSEKKFAFSSDIKGLLSSGWIEPKLSREGLYHNLAFGMTPRPNTCFEGIQSLLPGHFLKMNCSDLSIEQRAYWDIPVGIQKKQMNLGDAVEIIDSAVNESVKRRLISDVPVGTFMSGGIDSTTITAVASAQQPGIKAFTLAFDASVSEFDERSQARETAQMCQVEHVVEEVSASTIFDAIDQMVLGYEEPSYHLAPNFIISRLVKEHGITVILNGLGGDELFAGYAHYLSPRSWQKYSKWQPVAKHLPWGLHREIDKLKKKSSISTLGQYYSYSMSHYNDSDLKSLFGESHDSLGEIQRCYRLPEDCEDPIEALSYYDIKSYIGNHHLHRTDQFTMMHSIEGRFPFLDHELIELAMSIPSHLKISGSVQKVVLREMAKNYIAPSCLKMNKKGFSFPMAQWMTKELRPLVDESILGLKRRGILDDSEISRVVARGAAGQVWHLVMLELWMQKFFDNKAYC